MDRGVHISFTGHRPEKLGGYRIPNPIYDRILVAAGQRLDNAASNGRIEKAFVGMAVGFDQWMAKLCIDRRIPFVAVVPFLGQEKRWPKLVQRDYHALLACAIEVVSFGSEYSEALFQIRNEYMVNQLWGPWDRLIACFDGSRGGTHNCVKYAQLQQRTVDVIGPEVWRNG